MENKEYQEKVIKMTKPQLNEFSSIELLEELGQRIRNQEIEGLGTNFASLHVRKRPKEAIGSWTDNRAIFVLYLSTGKTEKK